MLGPSLESSQSPSLSPSRPNTEPVFRLESHQDELSGANGVKTAEGGREGETFALEAASSCFGGRSLLVLQLDCGCPHKAGGSLEQVGLIRPFAHALSAVLAPPRPHALGRFWHARANVSVLTLFKRVKHHLKYNV